MLLLLLTACQRAVLPDLRSFPDRPDDFPPQSFLDTIESDTEVLRIDPGESWLHIRVGRAGRLQRFGHNHIFSTSSIHGLVARDGASMRAVAYIPVRDLEVDRPELRAAAGPDFDSELSPEDREGTRANLLSEAVLDGLDYPFLIASWDGGDTVTFRVRDRVIEVKPEMTVRWAEIGLAQGSLGLTHASLGLEPFAALGGGLRVAEAIEIEFRIETERP